MIEDEKELLILLQPLPEPIKEFVYNFYKMATHQNIGFLGQEACKEYLEKALPAFTDQSCQKIWHSLVKLDVKNDKTNPLNHLSPEMKAQKVAQCLLYMENYFEFVQDQFYHVREQIKSEKKILKLVQEAISLKKIENPFWYTDNSIKNLAAEEDEIKRFLSLAERKLGNITDFQTTFMPVTRQSKGTGKATLCACFLHTVFNTLYGKPRHADVAKLVNVLYKGTRHTETSIASITQRSKKITNDKCNPLLQAFFDGVLRGGIPKNGLSLWITSSIKIKYFLTKDKL